MMVCFSSFLGIIDLDHEHSVSIVSMSVQLFTVPTVARCLIADENAIDLILNVLVHFCAQYVSRRAIIY